jgi:hypothetical protein
VKPVEIDEAAASQVRRRSSRWGSDQPMGPRCAQGYLPVPATTSVDDLRPSSARRTVSQSSATLRSLRRQGRERPG